MIELQILHVVYLVLCLLFLKLQDNRNIRTSNDNLFGSVTVVSLPVLTTVQKKEQGDRSTPKEKPFTVDTSS